MRIGFAAGSLNRTGSRVLIAQPAATRPFPGPWTLAAVIRISERPPRSYPPVALSSLADASCPDASRKASSAS